MKTVEENLNSIISRKLNKSH
jgi:hypothetical protein